MSQNLKKCMNKLVLISKIKNPEVRKKVLLELYDECLYKALHEVAINTTSKKIPLSKKDKIQLRKHKVKIQNLACYTKNKRKQKQLVSQSGGFLQFLIPTVASLITSLIAK